jgi:hypothetical protein
MAIAIIGSRVWEQRVRVSRDGYLPFITMEDAAERGD